MNNVLELVLSKCLTAAMRVWFTTLLIGALHEDIAAIPAVGWETTLTIVVLGGLVCDRTAEGFADERRR